MVGYPSGQRGQTVNLLALPSNVRIVDPPPFSFPPIRAIPDERAERTRERDGLRAENDELERRVAELRRRQNEFETNPEYVELTARRENRTKSGETVFDFGEGGSGDR